MLLQYAIWGAWLPLLYPFLTNHRGFSGNEVGHMFMVGAVGALIAPWVAGQIADRYFATEKFLALSHIAGGLLVWQLAWLEGYWAFLGFSLLYSIIYSPTLSLTNSISFHHLPDRDRDFGRVRVWGSGAVPFPHERVLSRAERGARREVRGRGSRRRNVRPQGAPVRERPAGVHLQRLPAGGLRVSGELHARVRCPERLRNFEPFGCDSVSTGVAVTGRRMEAR